MEDLTARLAELEPTLKNELAQKVEAFPEFSSIPNQCLDIARAVVDVGRKDLTPQVVVPPYPRESHRAVYAKDGRSVVIKAWNPQTRRHDIVDNPQGPAIVGPKGAAFFLGGLKLDEDEWRRRVSIGTGQ